MSRRSLLAIATVLTTLLEATTAVAAGDHDVFFSRLSPDWADVTTVAGSGSSGTADGAAPDADFIEPYGIASDAHGNLLVADRNGQRIRKIAASGIVTTIAGGGAPFGPGLAVPPASLNGPAAEARFDRPTSLAVAGDGTIFVADEGNHAVRAIRGGVVTTVATFATPIALALDDRSDLFVADYPGLREIEADGKAITLPVPGPVLSITTTVADKRRTLVVATPTAFVVVDPHTGSIESTHTLTEVESGEVAGRIGQIAAYDAHTIVFTDTYAQSVRLRTLTARDYTRPVAGDPLQRNYSHGGGYRDGPGETALFDNPTGIAVLADGTTVVADTGNRRIRRLGRFDADSAQHQFDTNTEYPENPPGKTEYRILLVGDSYVWTNLAWHESIGGIIEDGLAKTTVTCARKPVLYVVRRDSLLPAPGFELIENVLGSGIANAIVFALPEGDNTQAEITEGLQTAAKDLSETGTDLLTVSYPYELDMASEGESFSEYHYNLGLLRNAYEHPRRVAFSAALAQSGTSTLDLWPQFLSAESASDRPPLFETGDIHFTPSGAKIVGDAILTRLLHDHPWGSCPP